MVKICSKCGITKDESEFHKNKATKDGLLGYCKECKRIIDYEYKSKNRDKLAAKQREYRKTHKEKCGEYDKKYYEEHKETIIEYKHQWYIDNIERLKPIYKKYLEEHREEYKIRSREYYYNHINERKLYNRQYIETHREQDRMHHHQYYLQHKDKWREMHRVWSNSPKGKVLRRLYWHKRARHLGFKPINSYFEGSHFHHLYLNGNKSIGIFIPGSVHNTIGHRRTDTNSMREINKVALLWLCEQSEIVPDRYSQKYNSR